MVEAPDLLLLLAKLRFSEGFSTCTVHGSKFLHYKIDLIWSEEVCAFRFGLKLVYFISFSIYCDPSLKISVLT